MRQAQMTSGEASSWLRLDRLVMETIDRLRGTTDRYQGSQLASNTVD